MHKDTWNFHSIKPFQCQSLLAGDRSFKGLDQRLIQLVRITIGSSKQRPVSDGKQYSAQLLGYSFEAFKLCRELGGDFFEVPLFHITFLRLRYLDVCPLI